MRQKPPPGHFDSLVAGKLNLFDLLGSIEPQVRVLKIELLDATFRYRLAANPEKRIDQTMTPVGECAIEFVVQRVG